MSSPKQLLLWFPSGTSGTFLEPPAVHKHGHVYVQGLNRHISIPGTCCQLGPGKSTSGMSGAKQGRALSTKCDDLMKRWVCNIDVFMFYSIK